MSLPQLFGIVPTGLPVITVPTSAASETQVVYTLPPRGFSHIVVFLLPGITLPPDTAAAVYLAYPTPSQQGSTPNFKFLGGIGPGKESAIFKIGESGASAAGDLILGISIEPSANVTAQMTTLSAGKAQSGPGTLVLAKKNPDTVLLAQRIIKNAFNFLASFSGNIPVPGSNGLQGVEVVPLQKFHEWWNKFEAKIKNDPGFLERDDL